jgi:hypothetical protein
VLRNNNGKSVSAKLSLGRLVNKGAPAPGLIIRNDRFQSIAFTKEAPNQTNFVKLVLKEPLLMTIDQYI